MATPEGHHKPLTPDSLVMLAYDSIRESIIEGRYMMGDHLVETRIANEFGISRAPVREALNRLVQEGLAVEKPRRGVFIREMTAKDFTDIYNMRLAIEMAAVRLAVLNGATFTDIEPTIAAMTAAATKGEVARTVDLELHVHKQICCASGNGFLIHAFESLLGPVHMALGLDDAAFTDLGDVTEEHLSLLAALRSGNPATASEAIHRHITATVGPVLERLGGDPGELLSVAP